MLLAVLQSDPKQVLLPQGVPPASKPLVGPQVPPKQVGLPTGQSASPVHWAQMPEPPATQKGKQLPELQPSPVGQLVAVRHWTQAVTLQNGVPASKARQSVSCAQSAQPW